MEVRATALYILSGVDGLCDLLVDALAVEIKTVKTSRVDCCVVLMRGSWVGVRRGR